jgi:hypothetical protein
MPSTVRRGDRGDDVKLCQERLTAHGYSCSADGIFGAGTESKVMQFQRDSGLGADGIVGPNTWTALLSDDEVEVQPPGPLPPILVHLESLGHKVVWKGDFHLNLFGIRNPNAKANSFDDIMGCAYTEKGLWRVHYWPATTDPGTYYLENRDKWFGPAGVAILCEGQYVDVYKIDLHAGKYEALCQRNGAVRLYRDDNLDDVLDMDPETVKTSYGSGINLHASTSYPYTTGTDKDEVDAWSAGCQVHATVAGFREMMELARKQVEVTGIDTFTYTLMKQWW